jgi:hypothetical protein
LGYVFIPLLAAFSPGERRVSVRGGRHVRPATWASSLTNPSLPTRSSSLVVKARPSYATLANDLNVFQSRRIQQERPFDANVLDDATDRDVGVWSPSSHPHHHAGKDLDPHPLAFHDPVVDANRISSPHMLKPVRLGNIRQKMTNVHCKNLLKIGPESAFEGRR